MEKKGNDLQEELRSSQVYKVLTGSGIPVAGKIAQGLGKAAQGLDQALNLGGNTAQGRNTGHPYQAPPTQGYYQASPPERRLPAAPTGCRAEPPAAPESWGANRERLLPLRLCQPAAARAAHGFPE